MSSLSDSGQIVAVPARPVRADETDTSSSSPSEGESEEWLPRCDDLAEERHQPSQEDQQQPSSSQPRPPPTRRAGAEPQQPPEAGSGDLRSAAMAIMLVDVVQYTVLTPHPQKDAG